MEVRLHLDVTLLEASLKATDWMHPMTLSV